MSLKAVPKPVKLGSTACKRKSDDLFLYTSTVNSTDLSRKVTSIPALYVVADSHFRSGLPTLPGTPPGPNGVGRITTFVVYAAFCPTLWLPTEPAPTRSLR